MIAEYFIYISCKLFISHEVVFVEVVFVSIITLRTGGYYDSDMYICSNSILIYRAKVSIFSSLLHQFF